MRAARKTAFSIVADTPVCKEGKSEVVVGALKQETVLLLCGVESHPAPMRFYWTFNNSGELMEVSATTRYYFFFFLIK